MTKLKFRGTNGGDKIPQDVQAHLKVLHARQDEILANRDTREPTAIIQENAKWAWHEVAATDSAPAEWVLRSQPMKWFNPEQAGAPLQSTYALKAALGNQNATFTLERGPNGNDLETQDDVRFVISNREPHIFAAKNRMTANDIAKLIGLDEQHALSKVPTQASKAIASHLQRGPRTCHNAPEMAAAAAHAQALYEERMADGQTTTGTPAR